MSGLGNGRILIRESGSYVYWMACPDWRVYEI